MRRPTAAVVSFSDLNTDPRVSKHLWALREDMDLIAAGTAPPDLEGVRFTPLPRLARRQRKRDRLHDGMLLLSQRYDAHYWRDPVIAEAEQRLSNLAADIWVANDLLTLPLVLRVARGAPVIYDAHEYALDQVAGLRQRLLYAPARRHLCRTYLPQTSAMFTVCRGIADLYRREFGVQPEVLINAPPAEPNLSVGPVGSPIRLIHHGIAARDRHIERLLELIEQLDERFTLTLMLVPEDRAYMDHIERLAGRTPRVEVRPPVSMREIVRTINAFDIGLFIHEPTTINARLTLPNKLFEFIQARLGIAIGPSPEMARVVRKHRLGIVADDFSATTMARALNRVSPHQVHTWKLHSASVTDQYSAETVWRDLRQTAHALLPTLGAH